MDSVSVPDPVGVQYQFKDRYQFQNLYRFEVGSRTYIDSGSVSTCLGSRSVIRLTWIRAWFQERGMVSVSVQYRVQFQDLYGFSIISRTSMGPVSVLESAWICYQFQDLYGFKIGSRTYMDSESVP